MLRRLPAFTTLLTVLVTPAVAREFDTVAETTYRQVTWADFKGREFRGNRWEDGSWAHIASGITIDTFRLQVEQQDDGTWLALPSADAEAYAVMDKLQSGAAPGATNPETLAHEQLHFDVTEAFARRLTVRLRSLQGHGESEQAAAADLDAKVQQAFDEAAQGASRFQERYDGETRHGTRRKVQKKWAQRIAELFAAATAELEAVQ